MPLIPIFQVVFLLIPPTSSTTTGLLCFLKKSQTFLFPSILPRHKTDQMTATSHSLSYLLITKFSFLSCKFFMNASKTGFEFMLPNSGKTAIFMTSKSTEPTSNIRCEIHLCYFLIHVDHS